MPDREDFCRIDLALMRDSAGSARPFAYSKPCDTFEPAIVQMPQQRQSWVVYASLISVKTLFACMSSPALRQGRHCADLQ